MTFRYRLPLDPDCPEVRRWREAFYSDPMTAACGCADEIAEDWERKHSSRCERCRNYGCANIEVVD